MFKYLAQSLILIFQLQVTAVRYSCVYFKSLFTFLPSLLKRCLLFIFEDVLTGICQKFFFLSHYIHDTLCNLASEKTSVSIFLMKLKFSKTEFNSGVG